MRTDLSIIHYLPLSWCALQIQINILSADHQEHTCAQNLNLNLLILLVNECVIRKFSSVRYMCVCFPRLPRSNFVPMEPRK